MKKAYIFTIFALFGLFVRAQCPMCTVNSSVHSSTGPSDYGLVPSNITIQAGVDTTVVFQYLLPMEVQASGFTATVTSVQILQIQNIPPATSNFCWTSSEAANNHMFYPQNDRFGCVTVRMNTLAPAGIYTIGVLVNGCGTAAGITQCQNQIVNLQVNVLPPAGNPYFSSSGVVGCEELTVDFEETIPDGSVMNPTSYSWDFGDGNTANGPNATHQFVGANDYQVTLTEEVDEFYISAVSLTASDNSCYCGDIEETNWPIVGCTADPEPYIVINAGGGDVTLGNPASSANVSWSGIDIPITDIAVSVHGYEEDAASADDDLGSDLITFNSTPSPGNISFSTSCMNGSITIDRRLKATNTYLDTISILPPSATPNVNSSNGWLICQGDSTMLSSSFSGSYQWYKDTAQIIGATSQNLMVFSEGNYYVEVTDTGTICSTFSDTAYLAIEAISQPQINVSASGNLYVDNPNGYAVQWYANNTGNAVPIPSSATDTLNFYNPTNQPFTLSFTSQNGCEVFSAPYEVCVSGTSSANNNTVSSSDNVLLTQSGFTLLSGNEIAWAISSMSDGPITTQAELQNAIDNNLVLPSDSLNQLTLSCGNLPVNYGEYYFTPFTAGALEIDSIIWNPSVDSACLPDAELCLEITGTDWAILSSSLTFTFPDGSTVGVIDALIPPGTPVAIPDTITPSLMNLLPSVLPNGLCFQLTDLYSGNVNGTWEISATNVGSGSVTVEILDFTSTVYADSCLLISTDQVMNIPGQVGTIGAGQSNSLSFTLPPLPDNFPTINSNCNAIGEASLVFVECMTAINNINKYDVRFYPNPNQGVFNIEVEEMKDDLELSIFNVMGQHIYSKKVKANTDGLKEQISLNDLLSKGMYTIQLKNANDFIAIQFIVE